MSSCVLVQTPILHRQTEESSGSASKVFLIVVVMKKKGNSTANDNEENRTKVTPITPEQQKTDDIRNWTHDGASVTAMDNAKHVGRSMLQ